MVRNMARAYTEVLQCIIMDRIHLAYDGNEGGWYPDMDGHRHIRFHAFGRVSIINEANGFTRRFDEDKIISITEI